MSVRAPLRFDGRVAIVTGAGAGLGRAYALLLASRGCAVVVNDIGVSIASDGSKIRAADAVVAEINKSGGSAVADYNSADDGAALVACAKKRFGGIHIIICNAGILRDTSFQKMTTAQWDQLYKVHLYAVFTLCRAAFPVMRDQGFGRIILVSSAGVVVVCSVNWTAIFSAALFSPALPRTFSGSSR
jgi:NAD(P)-dependent dehydrogenase (short-subunit alcohol dehydrogenase family)